MAMPKLFDNPKKVVYLLLAFVSLFLAYLFFADDAEAAEFEVGATYTSEFNGGAAIVLSERFGKFDVGLTLISDQSWEQVHIGNNGNVWAQYVAVKPDKFWNWLPEEIAIGPSIWYKHESPIADCHPGYTLSLKKRFGDFSVAIRHWSNAGICDVNRGQDALTFGWRF